MSDYFLLDSDYQDFDFTEKHKLKFITVSGEQHGTFGGAIFILISYSAFALLFFSGLVSEWPWLWGSGHADGVVVEPCRSWQNWYTYTFDIVDIDGNKHQYTGKTYSGKESPCHESGDSVQVEYLANSPD